jgi:hypothetical protein
MARLYVVNCTGQNIRANYRLDFTIDDLGRRTSEKLVPYKSLMIPARQQLPFGGDWNPAQIQEIISQLSKTFGAVPMETVATAKKMGRVRMIFREGQPIPRSICEDVYAHNVHFMTEQGEERRRNLAVVAEVKMTEALGQAPPKMEVEFEQFDPPNDDFQVSLEEGFKVKRPAPVPKPPAKTRARRAA